MNVVVRRASASDATSVAVLEREVFGVDAWSPGSVLEELTGARRRAMVAEQDGRLVGYAVTSSTGDVVDLQRIVVAAEQRRTGVARSLLETLRTTARAEGAERMLLEVSAANSGALAFYVREGFGEIDRRPRYYRDGSDALVLQASIGVSA
jgi:ribosomal-protein-alanine acetyltransferase